MLDSLRSRLALSNLLITLAGLLVVVLLFSRLVGQRGVDVKRAELAKQSAAIARQVERLYTAHGSSGDLERQIDIASRLLGERIIVVSPSGRIVKDSARRTPFFAGPGYRPDVEALRSGEIASRSLKNQHVVLFQTPIHGTHGHRNGGAIFLVAPAADVRLALDQVINVVLIAVGAAILVWLLIGFYFTYSISRPLRRIMAAAREMGRGNYGARVDVSGYAETARLAESFNRMAEQIQQSNQVLRDFLGNVSHDLRTPLTMITGFSQALLDGTAKKKEAESTAAVIHDEAVRMQHLVDDLLQLTRLESGLQRLDRHPTEVRSFVQASINRVVRARGHDGMAGVINKVGPDVPLVDIDPEKLERVLGNLLDNALQHTGEGGKVSVSAKQNAPGWVEVSVSDTGVGIPVEDIPRVFERFYRADKSRERTEGHSGLGLAIVREIVEAHGGSVRVESTPGNGATFSFTVPEAKGHAPAQGARREAEPMRRAATQ